MSLKYIELEQQNKKQKKNDLSSSQRGTNIQYKSILFKTVQIKMQQNRDINALLKSGRCRVF